MEKKLVGEKWRVYGKMKQLSVQGKKWNKRILEMKENNELLLRKKEIQGLEQEKFDLVANFLDYSSMDEIFSCIEEEHLKNMYCAIKQMDKDAFIEALNSRIQDIRRIPLDYMVVLDYWAIALIKYAKGKGISVEAKYIEVGYIEEKDTYLFDF